MFDAMAGWMGFDPAGDDDPRYKYGRWPWEVPRSAATEGPAAEPGKTTPAPKPKKAIPIDPNRIP